MLTDIAGAPLRSRNAAPSNKPITRAKPVGKAVESFWSFEDAMRQIDNLPDFVPTPKGPRVLLMRMEPPEMKGGVLIPEEVRSRYTSITSAAVVVELGNEAYQHPTRFKDGPWCEPGDLVVIGRYIGQNVEVEGKDGSSMLLTLVHDDEIPAVWPRPTALEAGGSRPQPSAEDGPMPTGEGPAPEPADARLEEAA